MFRKSNINITKRKDAWSFVVKTYTDEPKDKIIGGLPN